MSFKTTFLNQLVAENFQSVVEFLSKNSIDHIIALIKEKNKSKPSKMCTFGKFQNLFIGGRTIKLVLTDYRRGAKIKGRRKQRIIWVEKH